MEQAFSARLSTLVRDSDTLGRLGGDEFVVLVEGASLDAGPEMQMLAALAASFAMAEILYQVIEKPFTQLRERLPNSSVAPASRR